MQRGVVLGSFSGIYLRDKDTVDTVTPVSCGVEGP